MPELSQGIFRCFQTICIIFEGIKFSNHLEKAVSNGKNLHFPEAHWMNSASNTSVVKRPRHSFYRAVFFCARINVIKYVFASSIFFFEGEDFTDS
jgi:hypothetical protein